MFILLLVALNTSAQSYISFETVEDGFALNSPTFILDSQDHQGVHLVAEDLQADFENVTGYRPELTSAEIKGDYPVLIGTLGKHKWIDSLVQKKKINVSNIEGKWETFIIEIVKDPFENVDKALVMVGSDKRGAIFGMYDLAEKIGVSPWHWWADVPVEPADELYIKPGQHSAGIPKVKYRGIFINDEEPALGNWAREKFGGINSEMYEQVFKLILRLKGNYLWPAMWGKAFNEDDPKNPVLADTYGIVMGTSHHEPMVRAQKEWGNHRKNYGNGEWNYQTNAAGLKQFWKDGFERNKDFENLVTIGMRGDGDEPMTEGTAIELLQTIVEDQRTIISEVTGKPAEDTPQVWALYKEVQDYYDQGMRVPDDVTLLLADDNWGNLRKLPDPEDKPQAGGYGIYYHFDYVGGPRNYKWLNTIQIERVWEQMNLAYNYKADELWVVNVGDLKPMEFPISFFLDYAWNPEAIQAEDLNTYSIQWAEQQFGNTYAKEIADILNTYTKFNSRRKPELLSPETYSLTHYNEANRVVNDYNALVKEAEHINSLLPEKYRSAFFQLVLFPVKASANLNELYVATAKNRLYANQGRADANTLAKRVKELYERDSLLTIEYHTISDGKWNHMMSQTHIGYTYWQQPEEQVMPKVTTLDLASKHQMGIAIEGSKESWPNADVTAKLPTLNALERNSSYIEVFNKAEGKINFKVNKKDKWIQLKELESDLSHSTTLSVSVDWSKAPKGKHKGSFVVRHKDTKVKIEVPIHNLEEDAIKGFVENQNYISIDASSFSSKTNDRNGWTLVPNLGRTSSAMASFTQKPTRGELTDKSPHMVYDFFSQSSGNMHIEFFLSPTLDFQNKGGLRFAYSLNNGEPKLINLHKDTKDNWNTSVANNLTKVIDSIELPEAGQHQLKIWAIDSGVVLQKILIRKGEIGDSYLGPPESLRLKN